MFKSHNYLLFLLQIHEESATATGKANRSYWSLPFIQLLHPKENFLFPKMEIRQNFVPCFDKSYALLFLHRCGRLHRMVNHYFFTTNQATSETLNKYFVKLSALQKLSVPNEMKTSRKSITVTFSFRTFLSQRLQSFSATAFSVVHNLV